jgi:uncharacterized protein (UPF0548 family)
MQYRIFPEHRMRHHVCSDGGMIRPGVVIVQRLFAGPMAVEMAVRVVEVFDERTKGRRVGFSYVTVEGHVERGVATFSVCLEADGMATFRIDSWSRPGNVFAVIGHPFVRRMQRKSVLEALNHIYFEVESAFPHLRSDQMQQKQ